jgi:hypothetical protein
MLENLQTAAKPEPQPFGRPAIEFNGDEGFATTPGLPEGKDFKDFLIDAGYNPDEITVVGNPRTSRWQRYDGEWLTSYRFTFTLNQSAIDLPTLYAQAKKTKPKPPVPQSKNKAIVVCWSDTQTGKVDHRGGTPELIQRIQEKLTALDAYCKREKPSVIYFLNVGDSIENFESGGNPMRTNDLSLMQQIDLEATFEFDALRTLAKHAPIIAASVGSNHCQWRAGQKRLGTTLDDWGIFIQRQLAKQAQLIGLDVKFYEPSMTDESLALEVGFGDHIIGLVHGHQASNPDRMVTWWRGQSHGDQAVADATVLVYGHYHHLRVTETGRRNGRSRYLIQCPTLDNGSSWYRQTSGDDSDPGLLVFNLTDEPFNGTVTKL